MLGKNPGGFLWTGEEVEFCIAKQSIKEYFLHKLEYRIEHGVHDFNITTLGE
ncbi:MAG: hypothetical protein AAF518_20940 [Spirochaetota bacterium]